MSMKKILIADDEFALRFLLTETLADEGYEIVEAEDGQEAVLALGEHTFDLIILDYMMPEKTGVEVCQWLRASGNANVDVPVILLTAKTQEKDREKAMEVGVTTYMIKPFSPLQLLDVVADLLQG
ncbi:response regulator transcription factor [Brevibacillus dissolubilis]|uniref:response regulator transcription factor n=1 Tax=Brevibacillus dissolubilis TaxID=1844116 RepID=UPI001117A3EA|nr:response regulator [Brevibacillus dissolubilis]